MEKLQIQIKMLLLSEQNHSLKRQRDDAAWDLETLAVYLKELYHDDTLHHKLGDVIDTLKRHRPVPMKRTCTMWIGHDEYENNVLYDHYQLVKRDFDRVIEELERLQRDRKTIDDEDYVYGQVEWLIDEVLDKRYCWE